MIFNKLRGKKAAAMEWAIVFGAIIFALVLLMMTSIFSIGAKVRNTKSRSRDARFTDQLSEYYIQATINGWDFSVLQNSAESDIAEFFDLCETRGYVFSEKYAKKSNSEFYRILTAKNKSGDVIMNLIVKEQKGSGKSTNVKIEGRFIDDTSNTKLNNKVHDLGITPKNDDMDFFLVERNNWHEICVGNLTECTVSFDLNGGSGTISPITTTNRICLLPTPANRDHYIFAGWSDGTNTYLPEKYYVPSGKSAQASLIAVWKPKRTITVNPGSYGKIKIDGAEYTSSHSFEVPDESDVTLDGDSFIIFGHSVKAIPNTGCDFVNWSGIADGTKVTADKNVTANIKIRTFTVSISAGGGGSVNSSSVTNVPYGSKITVSGSKLTVNGTTVTATPGTGFDFAGWSVQSGTTVTSAVTVKAEFKIKTYTLSVSAGTGGSVSKSSITDLPYGTSFSTSGNKLTVNGTTVTATANTGYDFTGWSVASGTITDNRTVTANFTVKKYTVSISAGAGGSVGKTSVANVPYGTKVTVSGNKLTVNGTTVTATADTGYEFSKWSISNGTAITDNTSVTASFSVKSYTVTLSLSNATGSISYGSSSTSSNNGTITVPYGATVNVTCRSFTESESKTVKYTDGSLGSSTGDYTFKMPAKNVTVTMSSSSGGCIASGTLITLADGTKKKVEDLSLDDKVLTFNHETGKCESAKINFIEADGWKKYQIINLRWSNGQTSRIIYEHGFFDLNLMKYVYIHSDDYTQYIGHRFYAGSLVDGIYTDSEVTLEKAYVTAEYCGCYEFPSVYHLDFYMEDMLSMPGGIKGTFNIFKYDRTLKYNEKDMKKSIKKYGLLDYESVAEYMDYETFCKYPSKYLNVSIGKGIMTEEDLYYLIERYAVRYSDSNP